MIKIFENLATIIHFLKTLIYVFLTMLVLTAIFGYSHLSGTVMSYLLIGVMWTIGFLLVDFAFSPRQGEDGDKLPSRVKSDSTSNAMRQFAVVFLSIWFVVLTGFTVLKLL